MPEVRWVDPDCLFQSRGLNATVVPVMGLDAIEAWLTGEHDEAVDTGKYEAASFMTYALAQVQAWKEGT
jgi:hypothetical protein